MNAPKEAKDVTNTYDPTKGPGFRAPEDGPEEIHVRSTTGHTAIVKKTWRNLPQPLHAHAIRAGCEVNRNAAAKDVAPEANPKGSASKQLDEKALIRKAIEELVKTNDPEDFTSDGTPKVASVKKIAAFNVKGADVAIVWGEMSAEFEAAEAERDAKNQKANKVENGE